MHTPARQSRRKKPYPTHLMVRHQVIVGRRKCFIDGLPAKLFHQVFATRIKGGDVNTVASCSVVSKPWLRCTCPRHPAIVARPASKPPSFAHSIKFLETHKHIAKHVTNLNFGSPRGDLDPLECVYPDATLRSETSTSRDPLKHPLLDCASLASLLPMLPYLRALRLQRVAVSINSEEWSVVSNREPFTRTLDVLELHDIYSCGPGRTPPLLALLSILKASRIGTLKFDHLDGTPSHEEDPNPQPLWERTAMAVGDLSITFPGTMPELSMQARHFKFYEQMIRPGSLRSLSTKCLTWADTAQLYSFLRAHRENIRYLDISITRLVHEEEGGDSEPNSPLTSSLQEVRDDRWRNLGEALFSCAKLEHLRLWVPNGIGYRDSDPNTPFPPSHNYIFPSIFSAEAPRTLRRVDVLLRRHWDGRGAPPEIELWGLSMLNGILMQRDRFPSFDHMQVTIDRWQHDREATIRDLKSRVDEELADLRDAHILRVNQIWLT